MKNTTEQKEKSWDTERRMSPITDMQPWWLHFEVFLCKVLM